MKWNITISEKPFPASEILRDQSLPKLLLHICIYYPFCILYLLLQLTQFCLWTSIHSYLIEISQWIFQVLSMFLGLPQGLSSKESACKAEDTGDVGLIPGLESSPGGGNGKSLQHSVLESPWTEEPEGRQAIRSQSRTQLNWARMHVEACFYTQCQPQCSQISWSFIRLVAYEHDKEQRKTKENHRHLKWLCGSEIFKRLQLTTPGNMQTSWLFLWPFKTISEGVAQELCFN